MNMTDEEMRIKIAEACGWTEIVQHKIHAGNEGLLGTHTAADGVRARDWVPDYINDLNAMHEAEKTLLKMDGCQAHWETYSNILTAKLGCVDIFHATARQRAEAFIKTLNLEKP